MTTLTRNTAHEPSLATRKVRALGTTAVVVVVDTREADLALALLEEELTAIDEACSRFRYDSEICRVHEAAGRPQRVSSLLFQALQVALDVARRTGGAVDPTVGSALESLGYDRDFDELADEATPLGQTAIPVGGWWSVELDTRHQTVRVPRGVHLDLGATAKALVSDRAAERIADRVGAGTLVSVGGDVAVSGAAPEGGWAVGIAVDSATETSAVDQVVGIESGGIASSSTAVRRWRRDGHELHHIVDPVTGWSAEPYRQLVSAAGSSCVDANAASTASIVWGPLALKRLEELGQPARLVRHDGMVLTVNGWPEEDACVAPNAQGPR